MEEKKESTPQLMVEDVHAVEVEGPHGTRLVRGQSRSDTCKKLMEGDEKPIHLTDRTL